MTQCISCGKDTKNKKYCSRSCAAKENNTKFPKKQKTKKCLECDTLIKGSRIRCVECYKKHKKTNNVSKRTIGYYRSIFQNKRTGERSGKYSDIRNFAREHNPHLSSASCVMCGYKLHVEICHIVALKDFPDTALISEVNHTNNLVALCPNCHWEFDNLDKNSDYGTMLSMIQSSKLSTKIDKTFFINEQRYDLSVR